MVFDFKDGYRYSFNSLACATCGGHCCRGESGYIWINYEEIDKFSSYLKLTVEEFSTTYLMKVGHRYSLVEKELGANDLACVFFDENAQQCSIYEYRPSQCRTFPFWEMFKNNEDEVRAECPGVV